MSDLLFVGHHPYLGGGDPDRLRDALEAVSELAPKLLVPSHGPVRTAESLKEMRQYVTALDGLAREMVEHGEAEQIIDTLAIPEPYGDWLFAAFFPGNMHFLYQRALQEQGSALLGGRRVAS